MPSASCKSTAEFRVDWAVPDFARRKAWLAER